MHSGGGTTRLAGPNPKTQAALMDLYRATNGASWTMASVLHLVGHLVSFENQTLDGGAVTAWNPSTHYCTWAHVRCDNQSEVAMLSFTLANLTGTIPNTISALTKLRSLGTGFVHLSGTVPASLVHCSNLQALVLFGGGNLFAHPSLSGTLPTLPKLEMLGILGERISGSFRHMLRHLSRLGLQAPCRRAQQRASGCFYC